MVVGDMEYLYRDMELSRDCFNSLCADQPWERLELDDSIVGAFGAALEGLNLDFHESKCLTQDLMWSSVSTDLEDVTKILQKSAEEKPASPVCPPRPSQPPAAANPPNQRSLLIKSQPQYQTPSSVSYSPPMSDEEGETKTFTLKCLEDHITCSVLNVYLDPELLEHYLENATDPSKFVLPMSPSPPRSLSPPPRPSFEIDHCYSKEAEPDIDDLFENHLGIDTPSETEDEEESERADESFEVKEEIEQECEDEEEEEEEDDEEEQVDQKESITRMTHVNDDEEEEIDVVSVSDHPSDIKGGGGTSSNSYLYPKPSPKRNVYGSYRTIPKKTLPIPERKCVNGKYILMDMEVPTPVKRNTGRTATKALPKKRRCSSSDDDEEEDDDDDSDSESSYKRSYSRHGSRKQRSPPKKRRVSVEVESGSDKRNLHNSLERMRRIGLKNLFDTLRSTIPTISHRERTAKVVILNTATSVVGQVKKQEEKFITEKLNLKREQEMLRKRLSELRKSAARFR